MFFLSLLFFVIFFMCECPFLEPGAAGSFFEIVFHCALDLFERCRVNVFESHVLLPDLWLFRLLGCKKISTDFLARDLQRGY